MIIQVYVGPETEKFLREEAKERNTSVEDLAERSIEAYCLFRASRREWNRE
jgi:hypothetical protein